MPYDPQTRYDATPLYQGLSSAGAGIARYLATMDAKKQQSDSTDAATKALAQAHPDLFKQPGAGPNAPGIDPALLEKYSNGSLGQKQGFLGQLTAEVANKFKSGAQGIDQQKANQEGTYQKGMLQDSIERTKAMAGWHKDATDEATAKALANAEIARSRQQTAGQPPQVVTSRGVPFYMTPSGPKPLPPNTQVDSDQPKPPADPFAAQRQQLQSTIADLTGKIAGGQHHSMLNFGGIFGNYDEALTAAQAKLKALPAAPAAPSATAAPAAPQVRPAQSAQAATPAGAPALPQNPAPGTIDLTQQPGAGGVPFPAPPGTGAAPAGGAAAGPAFVPGSVYRDPMTGTRMKYQADGTWGSPD